MAINFPDSPSVGDEFTGGGFTWTWSGSSWEKVSASVAGTDGFSLSVGASGNTTYAFETPQAAGTYVVTSQLNDLAFDIYLLSSENSSVGYTNASALEASAAFDKVVVYGASPNDVLAFEYKLLVTPESSGNLSSGVAPFLTSASPTTLSAIDDTTNIVGGNFANDVEVVFTGQDAIDRPAKNIVRSSSTSLIVTRPDSFPPEQEPFSVTATNPGITNPSLGVNTLIDYFDAGESAVWVTGSSLDKAFLNIAYSKTLEATDTDGAVLYSLSSGSLPAGLSLNSTTGEISGTPSVTGTETFTVLATDSGGNSYSREFSLEVSGEIEITQSTSITLTEATNSVFVMGGGGAGAGNTGAGTASQAGGGSGYIQVGTLGPGTYFATIGAGGSGINGTGTSGTASSIDSITANGGQRGDYENYLGGNGGSGGSGGSKGLLGGLNGASGNGTRAGSGSGQALPSFVPFPSASTGFYGGGGTSSASRGNGASAPENSGGGGQGSAVDNVGQQQTGGNGGSGFIYIIQGGA